MTLEPEPLGWLKPLSAPPALRPEQRRFREQLGLPTDRAVIMSGHQAQFWHAGILAKLFALDAAAGAAHAAAAWLVPDQDTPDPELARYPARGADGSLIVARWGAGLPAESPTALLPASSPPPLSAEPAATEPVAEGLRAMHGAIAAAADQPTFAAQVTRAAMGLAARHLDTDAARPAVIFASNFPATELFRSLVAHLRADPARARATYNDAVARSPEAGLRPLKHDAEQGHELPVWRLGPGGPRAAVFSRDLPSIPEAELAPRAMLLTGLMRMAACEVFIHGTGGALYDRVSEDWLRAWLQGTPFAPLVARLGLSVVASATLLLPLGVEPITRRRIERARWTAHHARHNPGELGDQPAQAAKLAQLERLRALPRHSVARAEGFRALHAALEAARSRARARLESLDLEAADLAARARQGALAADRTWPFPLHEKASLAGLRRWIDRAFSAGPR